jgi:hypothetical protein
MNLFTILAKTGEKEILSLSLPAHSSITTYRKD